MNRARDLLLADIHVSLGGADIIKGVSASFPSGCISAICGPNGAGKSTLVAAAANILPHRGAVTFTGRKPGKDLSFLPQALGLRAQLSVLETVLLGRLDNLGWSVKHSEIDAAETAMISVGISDLASRRVCTLSGGQQQLVLLAQRLIRKPAILLLDEPTSALDLRRQLLVLDILKAYAEEENAVVVIVLHDLSMAARYCGKMFILHQGRCAGAGKPADILTESMIRSVYGVDAEILRTSNGKLVIAPICADASQCSQMETGRVKPVDLPDLFKRISR